MGERSWWLQYKPPRLQAPSAKDTDSRATMMAVTVAFTAVGPGVMNPHAIMHSAGPAKAIPCTATENGRFNYDVWLAPVSYHPGRVRAVVCQS